MDRQTFDQQLAVLANQHGGFLNAYVPEDQATVPVAPGVAQAGTDPNPTPVYRYVFRDGTYLDAKGTGGVGSQADNFEVQGGTALKGATATNEPPPVSNGYQWNPDTGKYDIKVGEDKPTAPYEPTISTTAAKIWGKSPDGTMGWVDNPNLREPTPPQGRETVEEANQKSQFASDLALRNQIAMEEKRAQAAIDLIKWKRDNGYEPTPAEINEAKAKLDEYAANINSYNRQLETAQKFNAELPNQRWQQERERQTLETQRQTQAISGLKSMGDQGQQFVDKLTAGGVGPSEGSMNLAWSPWGQMWGIIQKLQQQGTITPDMIPEPMALPQAPQAPTFGAAPGTQMQAPSAPMPIQ
jgi:hypothetical protein